MKPSHRTTRMSAICLPAATAAVAGLLLAGCGGTSNGSAPAASSSATTHTSSGSTGSSGSAGSAYYPFAVGNTWVYSEKLNLGHEVVTDRVVSVTPVATGKRITMSISSSLIDAAGGPKKSIFILHPDGSISVPLNALGNTSVKVKSGSLIWPSAAALSSGQPHYSTIVLVSKQDGQTVTLNTHVQVKGEGSATVKVPAGTYQTTIIQQNLAEHVDGYAVHAFIRTWVANGVGPVQSEFVEKIGSVSTVVSKEELKSFTKG
jgi:hypothetical protein